MTEELQSALSEIIDTTLSAKDFVLDQAPDVIHQLLAWELVRSVTGFVFGVLLLCLPIVANVVAFKKLGAKTYRSLGDSLFDDSLHPAHIMQIAWAFLLIPAVCIINLNWLQIWIAPKVYLLEYAAKLID